MRDDRTRLEDILEVVGCIERYAARGRAAFEQDELVQTWIIHYLLVLGEAVRGLSEDFRMRHPDKAWAEAVGRRNILIHRYFGLELDLVWPVVEDDLPTLKGMVQGILAREYPPDSATPPNAGPGTR